MCLCWDTHTAPQEIHRGRHQGTPLMWCGVARSLPAQPSGKEDINQYKQRDFGDWVSSLLLPHCFPSVSQQIAFSNHLPPLWPLLTAAHSISPPQSLLNSIPREIQPPFPWFRTSRSISSFPLSPPADRSEVLPWHTVPPIPRRDLFPIHGLHSQEQLLWSLVCLLNSHLAACINTCIHIKIAPRTRNLSQIWFHITTRPMCSSSTFPTRAPLPFVHPHFCGFRRLGDKAVGSTFTGPEYLHEPSVPPLLAFCL